MEFFKWDSHFTTGIASVDEQHHWLVDLMNKLMELIAREEGVSISELMRDSDLLLEYANQHFDDEERLMRASGIDPRHFDYHEQQHRAYIQALIRERRGILEAPAAARNLLGFLGQWLVTHILGCDQSMAHQLAAIQAGTSPGEAYALESKEGAGATGPLLHALNAMLDQVMEKNAKLVELNETLEARVVDRTRALQEAITRLEAEMAESRRLGSELAHANEQLRQAAQIDVLTGLPNRRCAMERLEQFWSESQRHGTPFSCIMLDADRFKQVNDTFGHHAGDAVLVELARVLRASTRNEDLVARLGGDEFLILCPQTNLNGALALAESLRAQVHELCIPAGEGEWPGSLSLGVAERSPLVESPDDLIKAADNGLYVAKRLGRNRVGVEGE